MLQLTDFTTSWPANALSFCKLSERRTKQWRCPTLPSILGEILISADCIITHCADVRYFRPIYCYQKPRIYAPTPPQGDVLPMPISLIPATNFIPKEYQVHVCSQLCAHCGAEHKWSRIYAHNFIESRLGAGKAISNLVPVDHFSYNVPVRVLRAPQKAVPTCHACTGTYDLSDLPRPADTAAYKRIVAVYQNPGNIVVEQTAKPRIAASAINGPAKEPKSKRAPKSIDDII